MSIFRRGKIWYASFSLPGGQRLKESPGTENRREAQELHDNRKSALWRIEKLGDLPDFSFEEACLRWLEEKAEKKSLDNDKSRLGFWLRHFEGVRLKDITEAGIYAAVSKMTNRRAAENWRLKSQSLMKKGQKAPDYQEQPVSTATKAKHLALMKSLLRAAECDWKWLEKAPVIKVRKPRSKRIRWLTREEAVTLIDCMPDSIRPVVIFALATGLRRSNILDLEWSQIDLQRKVAWIHPENAKAGKAIGVALNDMACKILEEQAGRHPRYVFVHIKSGYRADGTRTDGIRKMRVDDNTAWRTGLKRAGITDFRFHDLRHTWASWLIQSGVPLSALQEMGGWESTEMVRRYAHLAPNHLTAHARRIDEVMGLHVTVRSPLKAAGEN